jgi:hypothetical protein
MIKAQNKFRGYPLPIHWSAVFRAVRCYLFLALLKNSMKKRISAAIPHPFSHKLSISITGRASSIKARSPGLIVFNSLTFQVFNTTIEISNFDYKISKYGSGGIIKNI